MLTVLAASLVMCLFGGGDVAHAQTSQVLVSNLGQPMATAGGTEHGVAQAFRTGANTDGYTLTSIDLRLSLTMTPTVTLRRGSAAGSTVASFTAPSTTTGISFANITFTPTTTVTLDRNTDYWVVAAGGSSRWTWSVTGPDEDATAAPGWSIADRGQSYNPNSGSWEDNGGDLAWQISVKGTIRQPLPPPRPPPGPPPPPPGPRQTVPDAPTNLIAEAADAAVTLTWDAPEDDGGSEITDYQYRINGRNPWTAIGSTDTTHTLTGLVNGTVYVFEVRAVNRIGRSFSSNRAEATPEAPEVFTLDFAHFANGTWITDLVFLNLETQPSRPAPTPFHTDILPSRPAIYFYDTEGNPIAAASVVDITGDLEITEDGALTVQTEMVPLGVLTISTHGRGALVSGSVRVVSEGPIDGMLRFEHPDLGVAGVGASPPVGDVLFPVRRQEGGITTGVALHNLESSPALLLCDLMREGVLLDAASIPLEANGQTSWMIDQAFPAADTSDFTGSVRCTAPGRGRFTAIAVEIDAARRIFISVVPVDRTVGRGGETVLDFAHFVNGTWITDLVFVNLETQPSRSAPTPFHTAILPSRPVIYFYDTEGALVAPESVVEVTGDLEITEDGALTVQTEMEPLGVLTISTHGRGELVSGSVRVVSEGPIGGMLRFEHPALGVAGVGASPPLSDALFPVRRQEGGITTGVALHNLESSAGLVRCDLMREGVLLDAVSIPLEANGQASWLIDQAFPNADTADFVGSLRCDAVGEDLFTAVALEMDPATRILTTLPVVPIPERTDRE